MIPHLQKSKVQTFYDLFGTHLDFLKYDLDVARLFVSSSHFLCQNVFQILNLYIKRSFLTHLVRHLVQRISNCSTGFMLENVYANLWDIKLNVPVVLSVPLSAATNMKVYDETSTTMRVKWEEAAGATGYMLLYQPTNSTEPRLPKEVKLFYFQMQLVRSCLAFMWQTSI